MSRCSNKLGYQMPCGPLIEFWEIGTHSKVRGGCHMSTFPGRDVTILLVSEQSIFEILTLFFRVQWISKELLPKAREHDNELQTHHELELGRHKPARGKSNECEHIEAQ